MKDKLLITFALCSLFATLGCGLVYGQGSGDNTLLMKWKCVGGNATLNFNQALRIDSAMLQQNAVTSMVFDSVPYAKDYTTIIVSKPLTNQETPLWNLDFSDSVSRGLTTEVIHCGSSAIRYTDSTKALPAIFTLSQTAPDSLTPFVRMTVGGQLQEIAEIRYYNGRMGVKNLRKVQSELAIRYGITLGPVDHLRSDGLKVWNHSQNAPYHHRITALAVDSVYGLHKLQSRSEMENPVFTLSTDSLPEGSYLVIGDNAAPMEFLYDSTGESLSRVWAAQATGNSLPPFTLAFTKSAIPLPNDSIVLVVDGVCYLPSSLGGNAITFSGVLFPEGTSHFTLCRGSRYWMQTRSKGNKAPNMDGQLEISVHIYPNPTAGRYSMDLKNCGNAEVTIFNALGEVVMSRHVDNKQSHTIEGYLPMSGEYYVKVTTTECSQTTKLIVKR